MPDLFTHDYTPSELIADIEKYGRNLSEWEIGYVDKMGALLGKGKSLHPGAIEKLKEIHDQRVG